MKAIRIHEYGGSEVLMLEEVQRPIPGTGELLIRVHAASVNPFDWKVRAGYMKEFLPLTFPATLGGDVSGTIEAVGPGANRFKPGDDVYAQLENGGGYAEYTIAKEAVSALKPKTIDHAHAAAVPVAATTAWQALFEAAQLIAGQKVLIHAAAGGVGNFAVQFAKAKGAYVIGTASGRNQAFLRESGVDEPIDYEKTRFEDRVRDMDVVLDTIGGETQERSYKTLKRGGILVSLVAPPAQDQAAKYDVRALMFAAHPSASNLTEIARLIDTGKVKTMLETMLPLAEARRAHEVSQSGHVRGKIVLLVSSMRTAGQLLQTYLDAISAGDMEKAIALFADDGAVEFPYFGSVNLPTRFQGSEALRQFFAPVVNGADNFKFKNIKIFPGEDQNHVSGEYEVNAVIKNTGRRYRQLYGGRLIAENGKIKLLREFCDTVEVARAMFPNGVKDLVQKD